MKLIFCLPPDAHFSRAKLSLFGQDSNPHADRVTILIRNTLQKKQISVIGNPANSLQVKINFE